MSVVYLAELVELRRKVPLNDLGVSWSDRVAISNSGDNYFPTIAYDSEGNRLVAARFTNQFDGDSHNRNDGTGRYGGRPPSSSAPLMSRRSQA
jgi:hypothetical protein